MRDYAAWINDNDVMIPRSEVPHISFPSKDVSVNMTMEVGITNATNAIYDIIELLLLALPDLLATNVVFSPDRIDDLSIKYENQTRQAR